MDKDLARSILLLVNDANSYTAFTAYVEHRIEYYRGQIETLTDVDMMRKAQGAIYELRKMLNLRETVIGAARGD